MVTDPSMRQAGVDTVGIHTYPGATAWIDALDDDFPGGAVDTNKATYVQLEQPGDGLFHLIATALRGGTFTLSVHAFSQDGTAQPPRRIPVTLPQGASASFDVNYV